jgi:hypothetical protein
MTIKFLTDAEKNTLVDEINATGSETLFEKYMADDVRKHEDYILGPVTRIELNNARVRGYGDVEFANEEMAEGALCDGIDGQLIEKYWNKDWFQKWVVRQAACNYFE